MKKLLSMCLCMILCVSLASGAQASEIDLFAFNGVPLEVFQAGFLPMKEIDSQGRPVYPEESHQDDIVLQPTYDGPNVLEVYEFGEPTGILLYVQDDMIEAVQLTDLYDSNEKNQKRCRQLTDMMLFYLLTEEKIEIMDAVMLMKMVGSDLWHEIITANHVDDPNANFYGAPMYYCSRGLYLDMNVSDGKFVALEE